MNHFSQPFSVDISLAYPVSPCGHSHFLYSHCLLLWKSNTLLQFFLFLLSLSLSLAPPFPLSPVLLLFSPAPSGGERRGEALLPTLYCPNVISSHSSVPASSLSGEAGCWWEGGDESTLIDKLNYRQSQFPPDLFLSDSVKSVVP